MIDISLLASYTIKQMECFRIDWKGLFSWDTAQNRPEAREDGIYAIYQIRGNSIKGLQYIGKSKEVGDRLTTHRQNISHFDSKGTSKYAICFGMIYSYETSRPSTHITPKQLRNIESFLINTYKPDGNSPSTKKGYKQEPLLIINTGKRYKIDKVIAHNPEIITLLKETLSPKKTSASSWPY